MKENYHDSIDANPNALHSNKDHKTPNKAGNYPTGLLIPATNFTQSFAKIGYKAINVVLDANSIQYDRHITVQSSHL